MRIIFFYPSLLSDWNNGNAHFLRGVVGELAARGHTPVVYEPRDGWSRTQLLATEGPRALDAFTARHPGLRSHIYDRDALEPFEILDGADAVIVHEWNDPSLVADIGKAAALQGCPALFHDTHHRIVTSPHEMSRYDLGRYAGVLAFGRVLAERYCTLGLAARAWTWHEAADTRLFHPVSADAIEGDLIWIGNWGDGERSEELREFLLDPARRLGLRGRVHGVRYPRRVRREIRDAGLEYGGWLPNHRAAETYARFRLTVHVPRGPYVKALPGIPTIRVFEALACGIPLICSPWTDAEELFQHGTDFLVAEDGPAMERHMHDVLNDRQLADALTSAGLRRIREAHTCGHRVDQLLTILAGLGAHDLQERVQ